MKRRPLAILRSWILTVLPVGLSGFLPACEGRTQRPDVARSAFVPEFRVEVGMTLDEKKRHMIERHLRVRDITDARVLAAMEKVPRERFIPADVRAGAYDDHPLPIGLGQTISQPYIVAYMTQALAPRSHERVLEIGTGSGYQAAILGELAGQVYSLEIHCELERRAAALLAELKYANVHTRCADGYAGWPEEAPFDAILLTAAPPEVPQTLVDQLGPGGRLLAPVGEGLQYLVMLRKGPDGVITTETSHAVRFVPMVRPPP